MNTREEQNKMEVLTNPQVSITASEAERLSDLAAKTNTSFWGLCADGVADGRFEGTITATMLIQWWIFKNFEVHPSDLHDYDYESATNFPDIQSVESWSQFLTLVIEVCRDWNITDWDPPASYLA